ncbi:hypothetical protein [Amycolatopsis minnesotensis]|uniref:hypothetical protein n=1 Tax=Amycolatopsis minnesotensis TaxID=337894 RepID=UPI0031D15D94
MPPAFWQTDDLRAALDTRHMGRVIQAFRRHDWHGRPLAQGIAAGWLGLTQSQLSRIETGPAPQDLTKLVYWARLLRIPSTLLWFDLPTGVVESGTAARERCDGDDEAAVAFDPMRRRTLMKWGVATAAATGLGRDGFGAIGMPDVVRLQRTTNRLCKLDYQHGGETLWQAGIATVHDANAMLEHGTYRDEIGHALAKATGNLQIRTGWLACDAGQPEVARDSFTDALSLGRQVGDTEVEMRALSGLGFQSNLVGRPREGLRFAQAAEDTARSMGPPSRMTAVPLLHLAVAGASSHDFAEANAAITRARKALDADPGGQPASWAAFISPMEIDAVEATCRVATDEASQAERLLERAIAGYGAGFDRNIALYRVRLTTARLRMGAVDGALETAHEVLDAVDRGLESWRVNKEFHRVMGTIRTYQAVSGVNELRERYTATLC